MPKRTQEQKNQEVSLAELMGASPTETSGDIRFTSDGEILPYRLTSEAQIDAFVEHLRTLTKETTTPEYQALFEKAELYCKSTEELRLQKIARGEFLFIRLAQIITFIIGMVALIEADGDAAMRSFATLSLVEAMRVLFSSRLPKPFDKEALTKTYIAQQNFVDTLRNVPYVLMLFDSYDPYTAAKNILKATVGVRREAKNKNTNEKNKAVEN
jgi:hypothetical protein